MTFRSLTKKIVRSVWHKLVVFLRPYRIYRYIYFSTWHELLSSSKREGDFELNYFTARPHPGAGIGHQLANWISGYWFAQEFGLRYAHSNFPSQKWESFLGLGEGEVSAAHLIESLGYSPIVLPLFDESSAEQVLQTKKTIQSYRHKKVLFVAEQDQSYKDQFGVADTLKVKFFGAKARATDRLKFSPTRVNIAVHVRRGDISGAAAGENPNLAMRWQDEKYFETVLANVLKALSGSRPFAIYLFSQGQPADFTSFLEFPGLQLCLDMDAEQSFLHMANADILIASKSSFSYKPALLSRGIKVCPKDFWHGYPEAVDWVIAEADGSLDKKKLEVALNQLQMSE